MTATTLVFPSTRDAMLVAILAYVVIGVGGAELAGRAASHGGTVGWRLAAWVLSLATFIIHIAWLRIRPRGPLASASMQVAASVAISAFVLAVVGPLRSHWSQPDVVRVAALSVILWPVLTGIPAFGAAYVVGRAIDHLTRRHVP